ncbi:8997_t:CDS:2 [Scutellospora calospora]|uniref:8997_t:CDS:1 n=1 Tax=Scutellospora calospora TaxID=85575 RepID=A0ACA9KZ73_9GLOM|nr:8997_t:CDS:2 [Scutellospora calospora]
MKAFVNTVVQIPSGFALPLSTQEESLIPCKCTNDNVNDEEDKEGNSFTESTTYDNSDNV